MSEGCKSESAQTYLGPFYQIVVYVMQMLPINHISWVQIVLRRHLKTNRKLRCKGWEMGECHAIPRHVVPDELCFVSDFALRVKHCPEVLHGRALELLLSLTSLVPQLCAYMYCSAPATQVGLCPPFQLCLLASHPKQWPVAGALDLDLWSCALQSWMAESHPESWTWGFSIAALHLFPLPHFCLRAHPQTLNVVIRYNWYDQIQVLQLR